MSIIREALLSNKDLSPADLYAKLQAYYDGNGVYTKIKEAAYYSQTWLESMKALRNPVNRSVEFFVAKVLPDLDIQSDKPEVKKDIDLFLQYSNFSGAKQLLLRTLALKGDLFVKVLSAGGKVFMENIKPEDVTAYTVDSRGYLTSIRIDREIESDTSLQKFYTELWDTRGKVAYYSIWIKSIANLPLESLSDPLEYKPLAWLGLDFIPIVHTMFRDVGELRGAGCVTHCLDKIAEADRQATRLAAMLFRYNRPLMVVSSNSMDAQGKPIPAPLISTKSKGSADDDIFKENSILSLPGMSSLESLVPNVNYADALAILQDMVNEIAQDLPELKYYSLNDTSLSGKAISLLLAGAIDRAQEARSNFLQGLKRLNEIALTIGIFQGIFPASLGNYASGDFEHTIKVSDPWESSADEKATIFQTLSSKLPVAPAMRLAGYNETEIDDATGAVAEDTKTKAAVLADTLAQINAAKP